MDPNALAPWRDLSIVWFSLWLMVFAAIPGVIFFFAQKYLRQFNRWLKLPFLNAQVWALRIQYSTERASRKIADVAIGAQSQATRVSTTTRSILNYLIGK
jgi:hypothetical protein